MSKMTKQVKAMQAALTALKSIDAAMPFPVAKFAIHHLEEALAEALAEQPAQQKPVAWFKHGPYEDGEPLSVVFEDPNDDVCYSPLGFIDNTSPQPAQKECEKCSHKND